jgi:hypothetical protein
VFSLNPRTEKFADLGSLDEACGDDPSKVISQGKSHVPFFEDPTSGELYFGTHVG